MPVLHQLLLGKLHPPDLAALIAGKLDSNPNLTLILLDEGAAPDEKAPDTLIDEVEPYLLRSELLVRTPRGRKLTTSGYEHLGVTPADTANTGEENPQPSLFD